MNCHICGSEVVPLLDFGRQPLANALINLGEDDKYWYNAVWGWCTECQLLQLTDVPPAEVVFEGSYPYITEQSKFMQKHFDETARYLSGLYGLQTKKTLEIGVNSGGLLEHLEGEVVGVEPAMACWSILHKKGIAFYTDPFSQEVAKHIKRYRGEFDLVYSANTLRSLKDLPSLFRAVSEILMSDGVFIIEEPYLLDILNRNEFDQFYSENVYGFTVTAMMKIAERFGMRVIAVDLLPKNHGGSARYHLARLGTRYAQDLSGHIQRERDVLAKIRNLAQVADQIARDFRDELMFLKEREYRVVGYGATAKSVTMLNYARITPDLLPCVYDTTPTKIGKMIPGVHIPIMDASLFPEDNADVVVCFPYNLKDEIIQRENTIAKHKWLLYAPDTVHYEEKYD